MRFALAVFSISIVAGHEYNQRVTSSSFQTEYTTITPSGSHAPVTVTAQYQTIPSYVPDASNYSEYLWVSTVVTDANGEQMTITKTEEPVTIRHIKTTITHTTTTTNRGYAAPTGAYHNGTMTATHKVGHWKELYEMIGEVEYEYLGPYALRDYQGSGLCGHKCYGEDGVRYQPAHIKEYKHGKWSHYNTTYTYGPPAPKATTYETPGIYTVPSYDVTVQETTTVPVEAIYTAPAGTTVTYGGATTSVTEPCTITAQYGAYTTKGSKTKATIKTTTIFADKPGHYTIAKPTITKYDHQTECTYPTTKVYQPGVYHHSKETVTITKSHQAYTCSYHQSSIYSTTSHYSATKDEYFTHLKSSETVQIYTPSSSSGNMHSAQARSYSAGHPTHTPSLTDNEDYPTVSHTKPQGPDPSSDYEEADEAYGTAHAGYVKRGGMLERRKTKAVSKRSIGKRVVLI